LGRKGRRRSSERFEHVTMTLEQAQVVGQFEAAGREQLIDNDFNSSLHNHKVLSRRLLSPAQAARKHSWSEERSIAARKRSHILRPSREDGSNHRRA
jgi:hypothetical protein